MSQISAGVPSSTNTNFTDGINLLPPYGYSAFDLTEVDCSRNPKTGLYEAAPPSKNSRPSYLSKKWIDNANEVIKLTGIFRKCFTDGETEAEIHSCLTGCIAGHSLEQYATRAKSEKDREDAKESFKSHRESMVPHMRKLMKADPKLEAFSDLYNLQRERDTLAGITKQHDRVEIYKRRFEDSIIVRGPRRSQDTIQQPEVATGSSTATSTARNSAVSHQAGTRSSGTVDGGVKPTSADPGNTYSAMIADKRGRP